MQKKQRYEVPTTEVLDIKLENGILYGSNFNEDGNEMPIIDDIGLEVIF